VASSKHQKSTPVRSNTYLPKAGPKSMHGGKKKASGVAKNNEPSLFERVKSDRLTAAQERRQAAKQIANEERRQKLEQQNQLKQERSARELAGRIKQASLAMQLLSEMECSADVRRISALVINEFVTITPNNGYKFTDRDGKQCSRTSYAEQIVCHDTHTTDIKLMAGIRSVTRECLGQAFDKLKAEQLSQSAARELVTA